MRYIHPVTVHEQFVASGVYDYYTDAAVPAGITEAWSIHELPDGSQFVRVDHDLRGSSGASMLVELLRNQAGSPERLDLYFYPQAQVGANVLRANYSFYPAHIQLTTYWRHQPTGTAEIELECQPISTLLLLPALAGSLIVEVVARGGEHVPVLLIDDLIVTDDHQQFAAVNLYHFSVQRGQAESLTLGSKQHSAQKYHLLNLRNGAAPPQEYWLDAYAQVLRCAGKPAPLVGPVQHAVLRDYARRPDPQT